MNPFLQQLHQFWSALGTNQKVSVGVAVVFIGVAMAGLYVWASRPQLTLLYGNLASAELSEIAGAVEEQGIPFEIRGGNILVPREAVHQLRMQLAGQGLPRGGGVGFEIFDQGNFGISDFVQRKNFIRALQGELARTITQLDGVRSARVMVVLPESRLAFSERQPQPTASVFVDTGGRRMPVPAVDSIRYLVANAVEGLDVNEVAVIDNQGSVLSEALRSEETLQEVHGQLSYRRQLEQYFADKIETLLGRVVGPGQVVARVSAEVDTEAETIREVRYDPASQVVRSESKTEDVSASNESQPRQVVGFAANLAGDAGEGGSDRLSSTSETRKETSTDYEINSATIERVRTPGSIKQLSAAVFVASRVDAETGEAQPRDAAELESLRAMVGHALGIDSAELEASVSVEESDFAQVVPVDETVGMVEQLMRYEDFIRNLVAVGVAVVIFFIFLRMVKRYRPEAVAVRGVVPELEAEPRNVKQQLTPELLNELIQSKPENVSAALRNWVDESKK